MKSLDYNKLIKMLEAKKGTAIVGIQALTDAKAKKTGNPFGVIYKQIRAVGFVGANYEQSVNREALRQGGKAEFDAESLPWGKWLVPNKVIEHKGEFYLRTQTTPGIRRNCPAKVICFRNEKGNFLNKNEVKPFLPVARESNKQQEETGIDKTVWVRTYKFSSIQKIRVNGETFELVNKTPEIPKKEVIKKEKRIESFNFSNDWQGSECYR